MAAAREERIVQAELLGRRCRQLFQQVGMPTEQAHILCETLVEADLRGVHSHGVMRVPKYLASLQDGSCNPCPNVRVIMEAKALALVDGDTGYGQVPSVMAMELALEKAKVNGIGACGVRNSGHFGSAAYYAMMALEEEMIGFATTGGYPCMAPWGGTSLVVGNNPIAYAIPAGEEWPVVLDMATSVKAQGWIDLAALAGGKIPFGWALDKEGNPTDDPHAAIESNRVVSIGGYKGYGMAVVMDALATVLTGADWGTRILTKRDAEEPISDGHFFLAIEIEPFMALDEFKARMDEMIRGIKAMKPAKGVERIYLPGELEFERRERYSKAGIPLPSAVVESLIRCGEDLGIDLNLSPSALSQRLKR